MFCKKVFIHIPKCGGNSVEAKLRFSDIPFTRIEPNDSTKNLEATEIITGHISYDQFTEDDETTFFSVMRSPLDRAISHYYYNLKIKDEGPEFYKMKDMGLEDFLLEHENTMCRHMFGKEIFDSHYPDQIKYDMCRDIMERHYRFIGTVGNLYHLDAWLLETFGCKPHYAHENRNEYAYTRNISSSTHMQFVKQNIVDYMLYEFVGSYWENNGPKIKEPVFGQKQVNR